MLEQLKEKLVENDFNAVLFGDNLVVDAFGCNKVSVEEEDSSANGLTLNIYFGDGTFYPAETVEEAYEQIAYALQF